MALGAADYPANDEAHDGEHGDAGNELVGSEERAGHQDSGADAMLGANHFSGNKQDDGD